jgi:hypothetical protein
MIILEQLHDSILTRFEFNWADATLSFYFNIGGASAIIILVATGVSSCSFEKKSPWGPSVCVNEINIYNEGDNSKLTIEMQSGDVITALIKSFLIT